MKIEIVRYGDEVLIFLGDGTLHVALYWPEFMTDMPMAVQVAIAELLSGVVVDRP